MDTYHQVIPLIFPFADRQYQQHHKQQELHTLAGNAVFCHFSAGAFSTVSTCCVWLKSCHGSKRLSQKHARNSVFLVRLFGLPLYHPPLYPTAACHIISLAVNTEWDAGLIRGLAAALFELVAARGMTTYQQNSRVAARNVKRQKKNENLIIT